MNRMKFPLSCPLWLVAASALLAGCASTHGIEPQTRTPDPAALALVPASPATAVRPVADDAWQALGSPALAGLVQRALSDNPDLAAAAARVRAAGATLLQARSRRLPQLDARLTVERLRESANGLYPPPIGGQWYTLYQPEVTFSYLFDFWGQMAALARSAEAGVAVAAARERDVRRLLGYAVAMQYVALAESVERQELLSRELATFEARQSLLQQRVAAGLTPRSTLAVLRAATEQQRGALAAAGQQVALNRHALAQLTGQGPEATRRFMPSPLPDPAVLVLPSEPTLAALVSRPDVEAARLAITAAAEDIHAARAAFYPSISLSAFAGLSAQGTGDLLTRASRMFGLAPVIDLPLFDGGRRRAGLAAASAGFDAANASYTASLITAAREAADGYAAVEASQTVQQTATAARAEAGLALRLAGERAGAGIGSRETALAAEAELLAARQSETSARAAAWQARLATARALSR